MAAPDKLKTPPKVLEGPKWVDQRVRPGYGDPEADPENYPFMFLPSQADEIRDAALDHAERLVEQVEYTEGVERALGDFQGDVGESLVGIQETLGQAQQELPRLQYIREWDTPERYGAVGDGIHGDTAELRAWAESPIPNKAYTGEYKVGAEIFLAPTALVEGSGLIRGTHEQGSVVSSTGSMVEIGACSGNRGEAYLDIDNTVGVFPGDLLFVWDARDFSFVGHRDYYRAGEIVEVAELVSSTRIALASPLYDTYLPVAGGAISPVRAYRASPVLLSWNGDIVSDGGADPLAVDIARGLSVRGRFNGGIEQSLSLRRTFDLYVDGTTRCRAPGNGHQYGLGLFNCQKMRVFGTHNGTRHGIAHSGKGLPGSVPCRDSTITATISNDQSTRLAGADAHGNCELIRWVGCTVFGGITVSGGRTTIDNCDVNVDEETSSGIYLGERKGGELIVKDSRFDIRSTADGSLIEGGVRQPIIGPNMVEDLTLSLSNLEVNYRVATKGSAAVFVESRGSLKKVNVSVKKVHCTGRVPRAFLRMDSSSRINWPGQSDYVVVEDVTSTDEPFEDISQVLYGYALAPQRIQQTPTVARPPRPRLWSATEVPAPAKGAVRVHPVSGRAFLIGDDPSIDPESKANGDRRASTPAFKTPMPINLLADSGRLMAPSRTLLTEAAAPMVNTVFESRNGAVFDDDERFIFDNDNYGGSSGALGPAMAAWLARPDLDGRQRYRADFNCLGVSSTGGTAGDSATIGGVTYHASLRMGKRHPLRAHSGVRSFVCGFWVHVASADQACIMRTGEAVVDGQRMTSTSKALGPGTHWVTAIAESLPHGYDFLLPVNIGLAPGARAVIWLPFWAWAAEPVTEPWWGPVSSACAGLVDGTELAAVSAASDVGALINRIEALETALEDSGASGASFTTTEWTPSFSPVNPADEVFTYTLQDGQVFDYGDRFDVRFRIECTINSFTASSGPIKISGLPVAADDFSSYGFALSVTNVRGFAIPAGQTVGVYVRGDDVVLRSVSGRAAEGWVQTNRIEPLSTIVLEASGTCFR